MLGSRYLTTEPCETVKRRFPEHLVHLPARGVLLYFVLHLTHLNCCVENFLKFPLTSLIKCFSITNLATSDSSTALILSARIICPFNLSSMLGRVLYAEH